MRKIIFVVFIFLFGCVSCQKHPIRLVDKDGKSIEPDSCYYYRLCLHYASMRKQKPECESLFKKCCKDRDYEECKDDKYRWAEQRPQECWDKKQ